MIPSLKVKKLFPDALLPVRANPTDSGADVFAYRFEKVYAEGMRDLSGSDEKELVLNTNDRVMINTGLSVSIEPGYEIQVRPRSGNALKKGLTIVNSPGTVDATYRGPVCVILANTGHQSQVIRKGDKIAQLVVCPVTLSEIVEVDELNDTDRGQGGFGSTG